MTFEEYAARDGLGLAALVRAGEVSPGELLELALARLDAVDPVLNAVVHRMDAEARETAAALEALAPGPGRVAEAAFLGVPFLLKDLLSYFAGTPTTAGSRLVRDFVPDHDTEIVVRYKEAGVVTLGKTNTPELGLLPYTEPELYGPTRNPWDPSRTPGGSSGGSAAAVAAGVVPLAGGGDGGGSIRIPASCCGLFGLKPSRGRTPTGPDYGEVWQGLAVEHVLTRSVRDSAAMLDAVAGPDVGAPYVAPPPDRPFLEEVEREPEPLRVALSTHPFLANAIHPECREAVEDAGRLLEAMGHRVEEAVPALDGDAFGRAFLTMVAAETASELREAEAIVGRRPSPSNVEPETWALAAMGRRMSAAEYADALRHLGRVGRRMGRFFEDHDVLVTPTIAEPPPRVGALRSSPLERWAMKMIGHLRAHAFYELLGMLDRAADEAFRFVPYLPLFNATGQPAMSVPLHWTEDGLPVGVHVAARLGEEGLLIRLAARLEEARPWAHRLPAPVPGAME